MKTIMTERNYSSFTWIKVLQVLIGQNRVLRTVRHLLLNCTMRTGGIRSFC